MSIAITFSGMLGDRPTVSDLFRRPERENRPPYMVSSVGDVIFWLPGQNTTIGMPTPLNGHGRIRRCVDGSLNMPPEFSAGFHAGDTSARSRTTPVANEVRVTYRITGDPKLTFCVFAWGNARWFFGVSGIELVLPSINEVRRPFQSHLSLAPASILRAV